MNALLPSRESLKEKWAHLPYRLAHTPTRQVLLSSRTGTQEEASVLRDALRELGLEAHSVLEPTGWKVRARVKGVA